MPCARMKLFFIFIFVNYCYGQQRNEVRLLSSARLKAGLRPTDNTSLVSANGIFAAGFHDVTRSGDYAIAVWYANVSDLTLAWMANRDRLVGPNSSLILSQDGNLTLYDSDKSIAWSSKTNVSNGSVDLILQNNGNLVLNDTAAGREVWQSFDSPTDTLLPDQNFAGGMKLISRPSLSTYSSGKHVLVLDHNQSDTLTLYYSREITSNDVYWPIDGAQSIEGNPIMFGINGSLTSNTSAVTFMASDHGAGPLRRLTLDSDGNLRMYSLNSNFSSWNIVWEALQEQCKVHGYCGENAICKIEEDMTKFTCICPPGFRAINQKNSSSDIPLSCERIQPLDQCSSAGTLNSGNFKFITLDYVNFRGGSNQTNRNVKRLEDCESACMENCNCLGFAHKLDGTGYCVHQIGKLLNGYWSPKARTRMYLKLSVKDHEITNFTGMLSVVDNVCPVVWSLPFPPKDSSHTRRDLIIICSLFGVELFCGVFAFWAFLKKFSKYRDIARVFGLNMLPSGGPKRFTYAELKAATNNFSDVLGKGGFGPVYRGILPDQRPIAVKKLEGVSQGEQEFWAEVTIIGRIHHLNLVRMWGFCAEGENRLLVYEFIPNGSFDRYLFAAPGRPVLDWNTRYRIAVGVARAIAYLHEECLEWILHCDIKPENILLDKDFCPKVSDFGLAKLVEKERSLNVSTIRGTRGYLAPEWLAHKPITAKADVYSFGMVLLEIVSGRRNLQFVSSTVDSNGWYFPNWAFEKVVLQRRVEEVADRRLDELGGIDGVELEAIDRMVKTALWCIQSHPDDRPSMGKVAKMLEGTVDVQEPPKPIFFDTVEEENGDLSVTPRKNSNKITLNSNLARPDQSFV
eukprot:Gb_09242 [translate_table: standard]